MAKQGLIVEDDQEIVELLDIHLADEGYSPDKAPDGMKRLEKAYEKAYDLVILDIMFQNASRLKRLVDELFELSRLEARQVEPHKEPFFINELLQDIANKYQLSNDNHQVAIKPIIPNQLPPVYGDVSMIDRVVQNLLDNALKFTPEGGTITLELTQLESYVEVKVSDTGKGIPEAEQDQIFHRYRKNQSGNDKDKGSGLGLAIVKNMLEIQGLDIYLQSQEGRGTTFYFYLPYYK